MYDYLIVGAGIYGATFARLATDAGKRCLVLDRREHLAGNCFDERVEGILCNRFGGHIFHTNSQPIWNFVNRFASFSNYQHRVKVRAPDGTIFSFPINLLTMDQLWGESGSPEEARRLIEMFRVKINEPRNFYEQVVSQLGTYAYEQLFHGYTKKQWGREPRELPASIAKRIPIRLTYDDRYFDDTYQGIPLVAKFKDADYATRYSVPTEGYTGMVAAMLEGIEVQLGEEFTEGPWNYQRCAYKVVYSGPLDELFGYQFGKLEYRSLRFEHETREGDYQGCATMNYADEETPYTRIIEWKHFRPEERHGNTVITREYPAALGEPYYPVATEDSIGLYRRYRELLPEWMVVGGRLGSFQYLNMDQAIGMAMKDIRRELG